MSDKTRQSSGGRSIFSRNKNKDKDKRTTEHESYDALSTMSSRSSRHNRDSSAMSIDGFASPDPNMMSATITSIPYDATATGSRSPIPVDYLPNADQVPVRREPLPHHLNKGSDFHQYPTFDPSANPHLSRMGPPASNVTMASTGRAAQYQQWGPARGSMASTANGSHTSRYDSLLVPNNSNNKRASDASVYSSMSRSNLQMCPTH